MMLLTSSSAISWACSLFSLTFLHFLIDGWPLWKQVKLKSYHFGIRMTKNECITTNLWRQDLQVPSSGWQSGSKWSGSYQGASCNSASHHTRQCSASALRLLFSHPKKKKNRHGVKEGATFYASCKNDIYTT